MITSFSKHDFGGRQSLLGEAAALRWLADAEPAGGLRVARVVSARADELVEERIKTCLPTRDAAERIGRALAVTHAAGAPWWGAPPAGWDGAYLIDGTPTSTVGEADAPASWGAFYAEYRVMAYVRLLVDRGDCVPREAAVFEKTAERLCQGVWDAPQPFLVRESGCTAARLHGDLWAGNLLWDADSANATGGALIDPMAHGGHAETDLAMLALFGCPYLQVILDAYDEVSPLADGWRERVGLHQLSPMLLHAVLLGGWFLDEVLMIVRRYV